MKIYAKRGMPNYKEKRLITELQEALRKYDVTELDGFPAKNVEELKALHDKYVGQYDQFEEIKETDDKTPSMAEEKKPEAPQPAPSGESQTKGFLDPFNDAEPIVRDYVLNDGFEGINEAQPEQKEASFAEPTNFEESFELPSQEEEKSTSKTTTAKEKKKPDAPLNPRFDEMSDGKKRRSTKKLAKMIVDGVSLLAEKGCIWWTTKDITEEKLVQYELDNTMDLQILLTLDEGQQITVREWFRGKVAEADTLFKVSKEDKEDLVDSLYEVLLEKGVAPTPMQELMINAVKTFVLDMGLKAFAMQKQIQSVLNQLKLMHTNSVNQAAEIDLPEPEPNQEITNPYIDDVTDTTDVEVMDISEVP